MDPTKIYHAALNDFKNQQPQDAIQKLTNILAKDPQFEDAYEALSVIYYHQKKYDEAIVIIRQWIQKNPDSIMAQANLSRCYAAKGMILEAEQAQAESRRLTWKADLKTKKTAMPKANYEEQIERYKKVIEYDPNDVLGYFSLASVYLEAGKKREAADTFDKALTVDSKHTSSYLGFGTALESLGDIQKAKEIYRKGIQVANGQGDIMPLKKMESRLKSLENSQ